MDSSSRKSFTVGRASCPLDCQNRLSIAARCRNGAPTAARAMAYLSTGYGGTAPCGGWHRLPNRRPAWSRRHRLRGAHRERSRVTFTPRPYSLFFPYLASLPSSRKRRDPQDTLRSGTRWSERREIGPIAAINIRTFTIPVKCRKTAALMPFRCGDKKNGDKLLCRKPPCSATSTIDRSRDSSRKTRIASSMCITHLGSSRQSRLIPFSSAEP
jgi:hypothetical protein